jgi:hypothetical protein
VQATGIQTQCGHAAELQELATIHEKTSGIVSPMVAMTWAITSVGPTEITYVQRDFVAPAFRRLSSTLLLCK